MEGSAMMQTTFLVYNIILVISIIGLVTLVFCMFFLNKVEDYEPYDDPELNAKFRRDRDLYLQSLHFK